MHSQNLVVPRYALATRDGEPVCYCENLPHALTMYGFANAAMPDLSLATEKFWSLYRWNPATDVWEQVY